MPTKSNNTGGRGGRRPGAGRKPKAVAEKAANGNPGGRRLTILDIPEMEGAQMPKPDDILSTTQKTERSSRPLKYMKQCGNGWIT